MRRTGLYSGTDRSRLAAGRGGVQAEPARAAQATAGETAAGAGAGLAARAPAGPAATSRRSRLRTRIGGVFARHERTALVLGGVLIALAVVFARDALQAPARELTQEDIDNAVPHTLETKSIPSRASKAAETVRQSVVRVLAHMDVEPAAGEAAGSNDAGSAGGEPRAARPPVSGERGDGGGRPGREGAGKEDDRRADRGTGNGGERNGGERNGGERNGGERSDGRPGRAQGTGSGVVIVDDGVILTNLHVVAGAKRITVVFFDGSESEAVLVNAYPENDLAVLKAKTIPDDLPAATLGSSANLRPGDEVVAVGFPFGIGPSVSAGVVSGLNREFLSPKGKRLLTRLIQFDAAANPGNSGGPLVSMSGEVVGIVTAILSPNQAGTFIGIGFATTIEAAGGAVGLPPF